MGVWGGTLTQLLFPLGIGIAFLVKQQKASAAVMFWWCGQNFPAISIYIRDSREQILPTIGGEIHDWGYLLLRHGVIDYDQQIGHIVWFAGLLIMTGGVVYGIRKVTGSDQKP